MNPCPNAASWNDGDGEADRPIPTPKRGLSGPANSGGQGQVELGRASGLVVGGLRIAEAEVLEDFPRGQAVLDDGNDLVASSALSALEDVLQMNCGLSHGESALTRGELRGRPGNGHLLTVSFIDTSVLRFLACSFKQRVLHPATDRRQATLNLDGRQLRSRDLATELRRRMRWASQRYN